MDELLKRLLVADILNEDTKTELERAFKSQLTEAVKAAKADAHATVTAELNDQWITAREALVEALDTKVNEALVEELSELKADIERYRNIEVKNERKLVESKKEMAKTLKADLAQLIEELDTWLEIRLTSELTELKEDLRVVKQQRFGQTVFEAFVNEFQKFYVDDGATQKKLAESTKRLANTTTALKESEKKAARMERSIKMAEVLSPLTGRAREVMEAILKPVATKMLSEAYDTYIGRVVKETIDSPTSEKETPVLAEGASTTKKTAPRGKVKTGDDNVRINESIRMTNADRDANRSNAVSSDDLARLRRQAGLV